MKEKVVKKVLLSELCRYFRLDYEEIEGIDEIKIIYIYNKISQNSDHNDLASILEELDTMNIHIRNRRKNLNSIYYHLKMDSMVNSQRYDMSALKPPIRFWRFDDY